LVVTLVFYDSFVRALVQASRALDALFLVDDELAVSLADGLFGADFGARAALNAIVGDYHHAIELLCFSVYLPSWRRTHYTLIVPPVNPGSF
jgi:hypothetical protein